MSQLATDNHGHGVSLARSRHFCEQLTRHAAKNFYYGLRLLPEPKRSSMFALYAFMRLCDDIADDEDGRPVELRLNELENWRQRTHAALGGASLNGQTHEVWPAFIEMVHRSGMPAYVLDEVIAGQQQDLRGDVIDTFDQLHQYCYRVAGVVGVASIYVWGFTGGAATEALAVDRGVAFQLTNVLRDLREDSARGRIYLPREELAAAGVSEDEIRRGVGSENFDKMMRMQIDRAEKYYRDSAALESCISADCRPTLAAMTEIYHGLLGKISKDPRRVLHERVSLSLLAKLRIGWRAARTS
jgi:phytoene synthase